MFRVVKQPLRSPAVTLFSVLKDELFFLPAFLEHYRSLGVEQFVFLDDRSTDGTLDYLLKQPDCAVVCSDATFGQIVDGKKRAVIRWRTQLGHQFCLGRWGVVVDLDEFMMLPPGCVDLPALVRWLDQLGQTAVGGIMIDFYPESIGDLADARAPQTKAELFSRYPYFDDCPHGKWEGGQFHCVYGGSTDRLMNTYGVELDTYKPGRKRLSPLGRLRAQMHRLSDAKKQGPQLVIHKVPLLKWHSSVEYMSSHLANVPPADGLQLPLAHFKFTGSLAGKIASAVESEAYAMKSAKYHALSGLLATMRAKDATFRCGHSRKFESVQDFIPNGILRTEALQAEMAKVACNGA